MWPELSATVSVESSGRAIRYVESFNGKVREELLNPELFDTLLEGRVLAERWRRDDNQVRPHSALGCRPPAHEARLTRPLAEQESQSTAGEE